MPGSAPCHLGQRLVALAFFTLASLFFGCSSLIQPHVFSERPGLHVLHPPEGKLPTKTPFGFVRGTRGSAGFLTEIREEIPCENPLRILLLKTPSLLNPDRSSSTRYYYTLRGGEITFAYPSDTVDPPLLLSLPSTTHPLIALYCHLLCSFGKPLLELSLPLPS